MSAVAFRRLTIVNIVLLVAIVVSGAIVRLSNSGLGCADWPNCNASDFVSVATHHAAIEQVPDVRLVLGARGHELAWVARDELGPERVQAVTAVSATLAGL